MGSEEHYFTCPYCWETISMVIEPTPDIQTYVEDCEVCCNPIQVTFHGKEGDVEDFRADPIEQ